VNRTRARARARAHPANGRIAPAPLFDKACNGACNEACTKAYSLQQSQQPATKPAPPPSPPKALGALTGLQLLAVRLRVCPPPPGAGGRELWTAVLFNGGSLAVACTTYYSLCGGGG
jgi:hypothetical protein